MRKLPAALTLGVLLLIAPNPAAPDESCSLPSDLTVTLTNQW